jgi:hypothetical protein
MRRPKEEPKLDEVKFVLRKLQRLDLAAEEGADASPPQGALTRADTGKSGRIPGSKRDKARQGPRTILYLSVAGAIAASAIALFAAGIVSVPYDSKIFAGKGSLSGIAQEDQSDNAFLSEARQALSEGDAVRARNALLRAEPERHAKVAFMLAQSYDPNYLQTLPKTNGIPDKAEARHWYEKWYELAVRSGLEMDSERLQRIINAMR